MKIIFNPFRFIQRLRHSGGFGVHSHFAFNLILNTIHTPHSYYIYNENKRKIDKARLQKEANLNYAELLFRLMNRFNAKDILEIGSELGINTLYIVAHSKQTSVICVEQNEEKTETAQSLLANKLENIIFTKALPTSENSFDAIVWNLDGYPLNKEIALQTLETIVNTIKTEGFIVLNHINKSNQNKEMWQMIRQKKTATMSFDLGSVGLVFFKPSLPKLNYDLYFKS